MAQQAEQGVARQVRVGAQQLDGHLWLPKTPIGLIIFAHGSGSSRLSPRNAFVAGAFRQAGLATLLFDLLTPTESETRSNVFDIPLLAERLGEAIAMVRADPDIRDLPVGLFGGKYRGLRLRWWQLRNGRMTLQQSYRVVVARIWLPRISRRFAAQRC